VGVGTESGEFEQLASRGTTVHEVSGRCGVYAKTDIQPLLNEGIPTTDLALSALHAVARQTIGGLAQGIDIEPPVIFEGGTLAYNPTLVRVFREQLNLSDDQVIVPRDPHDLDRARCRPVADRHVRIVPTDRPSRRFCPAG
jgi:Activator of 2-hydroxyglutaryl-CoA dehydratase (HSP70-class ATPase domain)